MATMHGPSFRAVHSTAEGGKVARATRSRADALSGRGDIVTGRTLGIVVRPSVPVLVRCSAGRDSVGQRATGCHMPSISGGGTATLPVRLRCGELQVPSHNPSNGRRQ